MLHVVLRSARPLAPPPCSIWSRSPSFHTTPVARKKPGRRMQVRKLRKANPLKEAKFRYGSTYKLDPVTPSAPLAKTEHPVSVFQVYSARETRPLNARLAAFPHPNV